MQRNIPIRTQPTPLEPSDKDNTDEAKAAE